MSFLLGTTAGALVAGGVYYGFSNLIQGRTEQHRADLKYISTRLTGAETLIPAPLSAASRVPDRPFAEMLKQEWNDQVGALFKSANRLDTTVAQWGKDLLYEKSVRRS